MGDITEVATSAPGYTSVWPEYTAETSRFSGEVNWVELDTDEAAQDADHLISPEARQ